MGKNGIRFEPAGPQHPGHRFSDRSWSGLCYQCHESNQKMGTKGNEQRHEDSDSNHSEYASKDMIMKKKYIPGLFDFMNIQSKNPILEKAIFYPPYMQYGFRILVRLFKVFNLPGINKIHTWLKTEKNKLFVIPVKESLEGGQDVTAP